MTTVAPQTDTLSPFDGHDVTSTSIAVTNASDGLSKALAIEPAEYHHGDKVYVVLETEVTKVQFVPDKDTGGDLTRVHVLRAGTSTIVDHDLVADVLSQQDDKNRRAEEARTGQLNLTDPDDPDDPDDDQADDAE